MTKALFDSGKTGAELALGLTGIMAFWLGIMKIGERAGMIAVFARGVNPFSAGYSRASPKETPPWGRSS